MPPQPTPPHQQGNNTLLFRLLPDYHPPSYFTTRNNGVNQLARSSDAEAAYTRGSSMPEIARSREPYPLDKLLAEIDTDQLLSVVTYPPEWYLRNVLSATEEAAGWARRLWGWGCETADEEECSGLKMGSEFLTTAMGSMGVGDVEAATGDMEAQPPPPASLESLPHEIFTQICERLSIATLWSLKCCSRRFSALVSSLRDVQFAIEHASQMVAILLRTGAAQFWTFWGLKRLMTGKKAHLCEGCFNPGPFVLLLTPGLSRKCWACLTQGIIFADLRLELTQTREVGAAGGLKWIKVVQREEEEQEPEKEARPQYRSNKIYVKGGPDDPFLRLPLPLEFEAAYTTKGKRRKTSKGEVTIQLPASFTGETLYNVASATPLYRRPYGITEDEFRAFALFRYMAVWLPHVSADQRQGHPGPSSHICWGCLLASRVTEYPDDPEVARSSAAWMELRLGMGQYRKLVYSRDEYLQHFRWCRLAQERWEAAVRNRDLRTGELVVPEEYETETLENTESAGW